jgi:6-pyruvoyltetrahydropterin/6-carboxytetrahydropterin synthase
MLVTLTREAKFDAAHFLPNHRSKCSNIHGHTWLLRLSVTGEVQPLDSFKAEQGMVVEMQAMKNWLKVLLAELDHRLLNSIIEYPTTERVLLWIAEKAKTEFESCLPETCFISKVALSEQPLTPAFWAEVIFLGRGTQ